MIRNQQLLQLIFIDFDTSLMTESTVRVSYFFFIWSKAAMVPLFKFIFWYDPARNQTSDLLHLKQMIYQPSYRSSCKTSPDKRWRKNTNILVCFFFHADLPLRPFCPVFQTLFCLVSFSRKLLLEGNSQTQTRPQHISFRLLTVSHCEYGK